MIVARRILPDYDKMISAKSRVSRLAFREVRGYGAATLKQAGRARVLTRIPYMLFATPAYAQSAAGGLGGASQFIPLVLIFGIMYFLLIRPQQKKAKQHKAMVASLRRGDQIVTQGGIVGKVAKVKDNNEVEVEIATGVKVRVVQSTITTVLNKTEPAEK